MAAVSAATTEVRFGRLQFATTRATAAQTARSALRHSCSAPCHLALTLVTASTELVLCPASSAVLTTSHVPAEHVASLVRAGRLWVSSGGRTVELVVQVEVTDGLAEDGARRKKRPPLPLQLLDRLADAVVGWSMWKDELGLSVRRRSRSEASGAGKAGSASNTDDPYTAPNTLCFLVNRPATPGGLCAPPMPVGDNEDGFTAGIGIPQAQLRRVVCRLVYDVLPAEVVAAATATKTVSRLREMKIKRTNETCTMTKGEAATRQRGQQQLAQPGRSIAPPTQSAAELLAVEGSNDDGGGDVDDVSMLWHSATALFEMTLSTLVGVRRRVFGVRPVSWETSAASVGDGRVVGSTAAKDSSHFLTSSAPPSTFTSLLGIAPAVWNAWYGQAVGERMTLIPTLSRLLATSGTSAQAPSLRRKASDMGRPNAANILEAIETRLHELVLKDVPVLSDRRAVQRRCKARQREENLGDTPGVKPVGDLRSLADKYVCKSTPESRRCVNEAMPGNQTVNRALLHPTPPPDDMHESSVYDICMDNLDEILMSSEEEEAVEEVMGDGYLRDDDSDEDPDADWREIEACSELDGWFADQPIDSESRFDDGDDGGYGGENFLFMPAPYIEGAFECEEEQGGANDFIDYGGGDYVDSYHDVGDADGDDCAGWQDVEDWQLERWAAVGDEQQAHEVAQRYTGHIYEEFGEPYVGYMDIDRYRC